MVTLSFNLLPSNTFHSESQIPFLTASMIMLFSYLTSGRFLIAQDDLGTVQHVIHNKLAPTFLSPRV